MMKNKRLYLFIFLCFFTQSSFAQYTKSHAASEIELALHKLNTVGSVLYIAAHPDDENTRLLSFLANEKKMRTGYLSMTRGDGGQNLIGTEQSELLGLIRTQELLAARRTDGAEQFFTRAIDFGYSKTPEETFKIWDKEEILSDVVWVIRMFQPDIIITRFPTDGSGGHGHHTASAILAEEAFDAAADPSRFPEQLKYVQAWQCKRLVWNGFNFPGRPQSDGDDFFKMDIGAYNTFLGKSYGEISSESRSQHKSQGFGVAMQRGSNKENFKLIKGAPIQKDIFDELNFNWTRIDKSKKIQRLIQKALKDYRASKPSDIIPTLIELYSALDQLDNIYWKSQKQKELKELILVCSGLWFECTTKEFYTVPGQRAAISISAINRSMRNIQLKTVSIISQFDTTFNIPLSDNQLYNYRTSLTIPSNLNYSNPYWLREKHLPGRFSISDPQMIGKAEDLSLLNARFTFTIEGKDFSYNRPLLYKWTDPVRGELYRTAEVLPDIIVNIREKVLLFTDDLPKKVGVIVKSSLNNAKGDLRLALPAEWKIVPDSVSFDMNTKGSEQVFEFEITPPANGSDHLADLKAIAATGGKEFSKSIHRISYDHIPIQTLISDAEIKVEKIHLKALGKRAGYIPGAGDEIPASLQQLNYEVSILDEELLNKSDLSIYDVIVVGIRAYNTNDRLKFYQEKLMQYVAAGGNLIVQYNTSNFISSVSTDIGPYPFKISRERVTEEDAVMNILKPGHPALNSPNKITAKDFEGWVQERGLYFAKDMDARYVTLLSCKDNGEDANDGSIILTQYGKGYYVYTGISFFRQLPAGVPGAYRLFANLLSLGKSE